MRVSIITIILAAVILISSVGYSLFSFKQTRSEGQDYDKQLKNLRVKMDEATAEQKSLLEQLGSTGKTVLLSNQDTADALVETNGCHVESIKALSLINGEMEEIVSTSDVSDVSFFTGTVDLIQFNFAIDDSAAFLDDIKTKIFVADSININLEKKTAKINVVPSSKIEVAGSADADEEAASMSEGVQDAPKQDKSGEEDGVQDDLGGELDVSEDVQGEEE